MQDRENSSMTLPLCLFRLRPSESICFDELKDESAFFILMIIFNTIKKAEHYVQYCKKTRDYFNDGYDWSERTTSIEENLVVEKNSGDSCGCGCDMYVYHNRTIIGRIKDKRTQALSLVLGKNK
jgi:hypothetical protein